MRLFQGDFVLVCTKRDSAVFQHFIMHPSYLAVLITLLYATLGFYMIVKRKISAQTGNRSIGFKHEKKVLAQVTANSVERSENAHLQGLIIGMSLLCTNLSYTSLPGYEYVYQTLFLINSAINPALYIGFNRVVRREVLRMLYLWCTGDRTTLVVPIKVKVECLWGLYEVL